MSVAVECDLWIHTNGPRCHSLPGEKTQTLTVVGSAVQFTQPAVFYHHRGIHKGNWTLTNITTPWNTGGPVNITEGRVSVFMYERDT